MANESVYGSNPEILYDITDSNNPNAFSNTFGGGFPSRPITAEEKKLETELLAKGLAQSAINEAERPSVITKTKTGKKADLSPIALVGQFSPDVNDIFNDYENERNTKSDEVSEELNEILKRITAEDTLPSGDMIGNSNAGNANVLDILNRAYAINTGTPQQMGASKGVIGQPVSDQLKQLNASEYQKLLSNQIGVSQLEKALSRSADNTFKKRQADLNDRKLALESKYGLYKAKAANMDSIEKLAAIDKVAGGKGASSTLKVEADLFKTMMSAGGFKTQEAENEAYAKILTRHGLN